MEVVIAGDFNLHIDNDEYPVPQLFINMMAALGLDCHVDFPTHENGHSLDLIFTKMLSEMKSSDAHQVPICLATAP